MKEEIKRMIDEINDLELIEFVYSFLIKRKNKHI